MTYEEFKESIGKTHPVQICAAILIATICYKALSVYDYIALKMLGYKISWKTSLLGSIAAYSLSHNLGFAPITATAARWKVYGSYNVKFSDIARIACLTGLAFWFGVIAQTGVFLIIGPADLSKHIPIEIPYGYQLFIGMIIVAVFLLYVFANKLGVKQFGWKGLSMPTATTKQAILQSSISLLEISFASTILWLLIPEARIEDLASVYIAYLIAFISVLITHAPGGVGVLEVITISMLPQLGPANVLVGLMLFRLIFHIIPLIVGVIIIIRPPISPIIKKSLQRE